MKKIVTSLIVCVVFCVLGHTVRAFSGFDYAEKLFNDKYYDLSLDEYKRFIDDNPHDRRVEKAIYRYILSLHYTQSYKRVIAESERFMTRYPDSTFIGDVLYASAHAFYQEKVTKNAETILRRIEGSYKDSLFYTDAVLLLADIIRENGDPKGYFSMLQKALSSSSDNAQLKRIYKRLIYIHYDQNEFTKASFYLSRLTAEDFENGEYLWYSGDTAYNLGKNTDAQNAFDKLIARFPQSVYALKALHRKAELARSAQQLDRALQLYNQIIAINPNALEAAEAVKRKIDVLIAMKKIDDAVQQREYFFTTYAGSPYFEAVVGDALEYYKSKKNVVKVSSLYDALFEHYKKYSKTESAQSLIQEKIEYLRSEGAFKDAIETVIFYIRTYPSDLLVSYMVYTAGRIYGDDVKDYDKAVATLNEIAFDDNYGDQALYYSGLYAEKAERFTDAFRAYERVIATYEASEYADSARKRILFLQKYVVVDKKDGLDRLEKLLQEYDAESGIVNLHERMGDIYAEMKQYDKAFSYYERRGIKDEKYYRAGVFNALTVSRTAVKDFIRTHNNDETREMLSRIYRDYLVYQDVTDNSTADDYQFFIAQFPLLLDTDFVVQYIVYLSASGQEKKILDMQFPETFSDEICKGFVLGLQEYFRANYGNAEVYLEKAYNESTFIAHDLAGFYYAEALVNTGNDAAALQVLPRLKNRFTLRIKASITLAGIYNRKKNYSDSLFYASNVLKRRPDLYREYDVLLPYAESLFELGKIDVLRSELARFDSKDSEKIRTLKGLYYIRIGEFSKGEPLLQGVKNDDARKMLYDFYVERNEWNKIQSFFSDQGAYSRSRRIIALLKLQKAGEAQQLYAASGKTLDGYKAEIFYYFAQYYYLTAKDVKRARSYIDTVVKDYQQSPWHPHALFVQANILITEKKFSEAEKAFLQLLEKYPASDIRADALLSLGNVYFIQEEYEKAADVMKRGYDIKPSPEIAYSLGIVYKKAGKFTDAHTMFEIIVKNHAGHSLFYDAYLSNIYTFIDERQYNSALKLLFDISEKAPETFRLEIQYHIGDCYFGMEDYQNAIREFLKVKYIKTHNEKEYQWMITSLFQAGKAYEALGNNDKAIEIYSHVIKISGKGTVYERTAQERIKQLQTY